MDAVFAITVIGPQCKKRLCCPLVEDFPPFTRVVNIKEIDKAIRKTDSRYEYVTYQNQKT